MYEYKGFQYIVEYDEEKPNYLRWRFSIYKQSGGDLVRVSIDYASTQTDADLAAREYIDTWEEM